MRYQNLTEPQASLLMWLDAMDKESSHKIFCEYRGHIPFCEFEWQSGDLLYDFAKELEDDACNEFINEFNQ